MSDPLDGTTPGRTPVDDIPTVTTSPGGTPLPGEPVAVPVGTGPLDVEPTSGSESSAGSTARDAAQQGQQVASDAADSAKQVASNASESAKQVASSATDSARQVASTATESARDVASTAADQARQVASTATDQARSVVSQAVSQLSEQAESQTQRAGQGLRALSEQANALAQGRVDDAGPLGSIAEQAADRLQQLAQRVENGGLEGLLGDVQQFARRRPGAFLVSAAAIGFLAGRVGRSVQAAGSGSSQQPAIPPTTGYAAPVTPAPVTPAVPVTPVGTDLDLGTAELDPIPPASGLDPNLPRR